MIETTQKERIYPDIPENPHAYRLSTCSRILETMKKNLEEDTKKRNKYLRKHSRLRQANIFSSAGASVLSISGAGVSTTGFGVVIGVPLIRVGALLGISSLVTVALDKETVRKLTIYEKLISLGQSKISSIHKMVSKSLQDENISDEEFKTMSDERNSYESQRTEIMKIPKKEETLRKSQSTRLLAEQMAEKLVEVIQRSKTS